MTLTGSFFLYLPVKKRWKTQVKGFQLCHKNSSSQYNFVCLGGKQLINNMNKSNFFQSIVIIKSTFIDSMSYMLNSTFFHML